MIDWQNMPPLTALRAFAVYAEVGNVSAAGARLNVSHAAISQQIRALEAHMGLTLLDRSGRQAVLTAQGQQLAEALNQGFGDIARTVAAMTGADAVRPVQISATPSFAAQWLMPRLGALRAAHPDIDMMIDPTPAVRPLEPGGIDIALRYGTGDWPGVAAEMLVPSPYAIVAAPDLVGKAAIDRPDQLLDYPWLQELGTNESTDWMARNGITAGRTRAMTTLPGNLMLEAARAGQGVAIVAKALIEDDLRAGRLRLLFTDYQSKGYYLCTLPGVLRPPVRTVVTWLRRQRPV